MIVRPLHLVVACTLLAAAVAVPAGHAQNDVRLDVRSGAANRVPIRCLALAPAGDRDAGKSSVQADEVLANDLQNAAVFAIVRAWDGLGASAEVQAEVGGRWTVSGSQVTLAGEVHDWPGKKPIFVRQYRGPLAQWRSLVHHFADDIVMQFTGEPGVASTRIAFIVDQSRTKEMWVMDADGANARQITRDGSIAQLPSWSPDGSLLLFTTYRGGTGPQLWVVSPEAGRPFLVSGRPGLNTGGAYSPDGRGIACTLGLDGNAELYHLDARGGSPERLTTNRAIDTSPCWSPTGREIAFTTDRSGTPQVHVMDADGGNVRRLTYDVDYTDSPSWSPKGDRIAFVARTGGGFDLWVCRPDGTGAMRVVSGGANENPHWSPDGRHLVFTSDREGSRSLWVTDLDGAAPRKLDTGGRKALSPAWSPRGGPAAPH
jgi:TolB protein